MGSKILLDAFCDELQKIAQGKVPGDAPEGKAKEKDGKLTAAGREAIPSSKFAIPLKKAKKIGVAGEIKGEAAGKYPIHDLAHARNALARVSAYGNPAEQAAVRSKVYSKYPELKKSYEERHGEKPPTASK